MVPKNMQIDVLHKKELWYDKGAGNKEREEMTVQESDAQQMLAIAGLAARLMLQNGAETYRVEDTVLRMGCSFGFSGIDALAFSTGIVISISGEPCHQAVVRRVSRRNTNLTIVDEVNALSRRVAAGNLTMQETWDALKEIEKTPSTKPWQMVLCAGTAAGLFAVMFGGGALEFAVAMVCGLLGQIVGYLFRKEDLQLVLSSLFGGAVSAIVSMGAFFLFRLDMSSLESIISGAILPLMSGLMMTNAVRDTMRGDLVSGLGRGAEALLVAVMVAVGIGVVIQFYLPTDASVAVTAPPFWLSVLCSAVATLLYAVLMSVPVHSMPITAVIALVGYAVYLGLWEAAGEQTGLFAASAVICMLSEYSARRFKMVTTLFLCTALMPLVPGLGLFRTMRDLVLGNYGDALIHGANTLFSLGSIALGIALGSLTVRNTMRALRRRRS